MIYREHYLNKIRPFYDDNLIKIITGIRRCGKSVVMEQIIEELAKKSDNLIYLNFERSSIRNKIRNEAELVDYVEKNRKSGKCYLFLDEVQEIEGWNHACRSLRLDNTSLFITGSNSKLLSKEFTKELSGRYVSFRIKPFVYKEILEFSKELGIDVSIEDYLIYGGFPKSVAISEKEEKITYLEDLDETIVSNDLIIRYNIKNTELFKRLVNFVLISNARIFSANAITNYIKKEKIGGTPATIMKYLGYLEEAYVINKISKYSAKAKRELDFYAKIYNEDVAFNTIRCSDNRYDITHNFENVIYNELIYMGYDLQVYNTGDQEIDFLASGNGKKYYIQAAYSVADEKAYDREFGVFNKVDNLNQRIVISNDNFDYSTSTVRHIKFRDFLMMENLE